VPSRIGNCAGSGTVNLHHTRTDGKGYVFLRVRSSGRGVEISFHNHSTRNRICISVATLGNVTNKHAGITPQSRETLRCRDHCGYCATNRKKDRYYQVLEWGQNADGQLRTMC
jgi:hypothetical protein